MTKFYSGIVGKRPNPAAGVVIHNDAGSQNANANFYRNWLPTHEAEDGFAHVYIGSDGRYQAENYDNMAWHTANADGNANYVGWEVCQSTGDEKTFLENEQKVFQDVANYMKSVGMTPNRNTVRLHKEFSATSCPHRSWDLHGGTVDSVKDYFISQIKKYMNGDSAAAVTPAPVQPTPPQPSKENDVDYMRKYGQVRWNGKQFAVDDRSKYAGILQVVSRELCGMGAEPITDTIRHNNGVPMAAISWTDGTPNSSTEGTRFKFDDDLMNIVDYDSSSNGIAVMLAGYKVWVDATTARRA